MQNNSNSNSKYTFHGYNIVKLKYDKRIRF